MTTQQTSNGEERREAAYPYYDLESSIKFSDTIKQLGGSKEGVKKSLLAKQLGIAESTPSFFQKLSSAKVFGIIQGWGAYALTDIGRDYFYPQSEQARKSALFSMLSAPKAFSFILRRFDGEQLPANSILGNILHQELGITDSWKDRVAQAFNRSANFAGIIDNSGFLRYGAEMHTASILPTEAKDYTQANASPVPQKAQSIVSAEPPVTISSSGTIWQFKQIRLETPEDLSRELWEKLNKYVQILEPAKAESEK